MDSNPIQQFSDWFEEAKECRGIELPEAMCLATVDEAGHPNSRMVLLKGFNETGFIFYTHLESPKAKSLERHPFASLTFYWEKLHKQVRILGEVQPVSSTEADDYFKTRPRLSQIAAWTSKQSSELDSRETLDKQFDTFFKQYKGKDVPRPSFWSGFRVVPQEMEFWEERPNRLHDRFLYTLEGEGDLPKRWAMKRLYP